MTFPFPLLQTTPLDVRSLAPDVLRHRILRTYKAETEEISTEQIITTILEKLPYPSKIPHFVPV